jgi:hypothetical protein
MAVDASRAVSPTQRQGSQRPLLRGCIPLAVLSQQHDNTEMSRFAGESLHCTSHAGTNLAASTLGGDDTSRSPPRHQPSAGSCLCGRRDIFTSLSGEVARSDIYRVEYFLEKNVGERIASHYCSPPLHMGASTCVPIGPSSRPLHPQPALLMA